MDNPSYTLATEQGDSSFGEQPLQDPHTPREHSGVRIEMKEAYAMENGGHGSITPVETYHKQEDNFPAQDTPAENGHAQKGRPGSGVSGTQDPDAHAHPEPWLFPRWLVTYPRAVFFVTLGLHGLLLFILAILLAVGYPVLPIVFDSLPLEMRDRDDFLRGVAWQFRDDEDANKVIMERKYTADVQDLRSEFYENIDLFFEDKKGKNVFTKKKLKKMKDIEDDLFYIKDFQDDFCMLFSGICIPPTSVLRFFDGTFAAVDTAFNDTDFDDIVNVLYLASYYNETKSTLAYVLAEGAKISETKAESHAVRGYMSVGYPLRGFKDAEKKVEKQDDELSDFYDKTFTKKAEKHFEKSADGLNFYYSSPLIATDYIMNAVFQDIGLFLGSFTFIFLFMWFMTRSLFVTFFGIISVVNGFIITDILYICVLQYEYLGIFHVLSLFIVLGIGADDIFVFVDTWKESGFASWPSVAHRMDHTYRHAAEAMLYTSLTTACAFFVSAGSPFLAINSFGIFSGILICVNYFSVVLHFPAIVAVHHLYFEKYKCCCCCPAQEQEEGIQGKEPSTEEKGVIVRFLAGPYWRFISHRIIKFVVLGVFAGIIAVFIYFASTLEVMEEQIKFVSSSTNIGSAQDMLEEFGTGDTPQRVFLVWGLKNQDLDNCGSSDPECYGKTVFNNKFNLKSESVQQDLMDFCDKIKNLDNKMIKDLKIRRNIVTDEPEVNCFMQEMQDFLDVDEVRTVYNPDTGVTGARYPAGTHLQVPVTQDNVTAMMDAVDYIYDTGLLAAGFDRWFEIAMSYWLYDGMPVNPATNKTVLGSQFPYYSPLLGVSKEDYTVTFQDPDDLVDYEYRYATRLRYAAITVNLTIMPTSLAFPDGLPIRDEWEDFMEKEMKSMPSELKGGFQCTPVDYYGFNLWHWLYVQESLAMSAFQGVLIGLGLALPILIVATRNLILGLLSTLNICLITLCVIGFIPMMGWKLGVLESLNLVLVVGLAVDYCVHLAEGYARSRHPTRELRVRQTLEEVGISVLSGAATTLGSSFFLLFSVIIFFLQFGIFMFATIGFSVTFSIVFFMALLATIGPQGDTGSIMPFVNWVKRTCCKSCGKGNRSSPQPTNSTA